VTNRAGRLWRIFILVICGLLLTMTATQARDDAGHSIGKVSTRGNVVVVELNEGALGKKNLFNLAGRTLRFIPQGRRYRVQTGPLRWESGAGSQPAGPAVTLHQFAFPFSGKRWTSFLVGTSGSIRFGARDAGRDPYGKVDGGVTLGRFDQLSEAAGTVFDSAPAICAFLKPRMSGPHDVKERADRVVITWDLTEPFGGLLDYTWFKTTNRFQAVLHRDGSIELSYQRLAAKDGIVGVFPALSNAEQPLATIAVPAHPALPPHLDVRRLRLSVRDGALLKVTFETRGPVRPPGDRAVDGIGYHVTFASAGSRRGGAGVPTDWAIDGSVDPSDATGSATQYATSGSGVSAKVSVRGNAIAIEGALPAALRTAGQMLVSGEVVTGGDRAKVVERIEPRAVRLSKSIGPEVHFSALTRTDGPFAAAYESFHYLALPRPQDLSCTVINGFGDTFDFLAYYSDVRFDNQEASSPSDGPLGRAVTGIGQTGHGDIDIATRCTHGKFQLGYLMPVYVGANEMQEQPPRAARPASRGDITSFTGRLAEASADGKPRPYGYAIAHLGHEVAHRWAAYVTAKVDGKRIPLGPWPHWAPGLQTAVVYPYSLPSESSTMGGGVWQDNVDGTYTQLRDGYLVPAAGYSYLDMYLMGFIAAAEVPDFFLLTDLVSAGQDANGHSLFKAQRTKVTIGDVIAAEGPRLPDVRHSQRRFNTGIVMVVEHGQAPTRELRERAGGIGRQWIEYWSTVTGHRASMTVRPR
jgi:hypothetical protein